MKQLLLPILLLIMFTIASIMLIFAIFMFLSAQEVFSEGSEAQNSDTLLLIGNSCVMARGSVYYPKPKVYASLSGKYDKLIDCLIKYESGGNELAVGDDGRAFSVLQFHKPTFNHFSKKYQVELDYYNSDDQVILAELMFEDDIGNVKHWSVWRLCVGK